MNSHKIGYYVENNDIEKVKAALAAGESPDTLIEFGTPILFHGMPILFVVQSPEMMTLLLQYGANPNEQNLVYGEKDLLAYLFSPQSAPPDSHNIIAALANHRPCLLPNNKIHAALKKIVGNQRQAISYIPPVDDDVFIHVVTSLIRASTNLLNPTNSDSRDDILFYSVVHNEEILFKLMLDNNFHLWNVLQSKNFELISLLPERPIEDISHKNEKKYQNIIHEHAIHKYLKILDIYLLMKLCLVNTLSPDILLYSAQCLLKSE
jgi:hypothetical protein